MKRILIATDSTSDLSPELIERYGIAVLPMHVNLGSDERLDGVDISPEEIYKWSDEHKETPKTSAISPSEAEAFIERALELGENTVFFCISQTMSSCYSVLKMTVSMLGVEDRVHIIDSENLSTGIGLQILEAAEMSEAGAGIQEILARIESIKPRIHASFVVDTLTYLHRGGRCSGLAALAGNTLKLHPSIYVNGGKMQVGKKYRGSVNKAIKNYVEDMHAQLKAAEPGRIFITHSGCDENVINSVKMQLEEIDRFKQIHITQAGSVISCHCGPATLGVLFISGE